MTADPASPKQVPVDSAPVVNSDTKPYDDLGSPRHVHEGASTYGDKGSEIFESVDPSGVPRFVPAPGSSVSKLSHDAQRTFRTKLLYNALFTPAAKIFKKFPIFKEAPPGAQDITETMQTEVKRRRGVLLDEFPISDKVRHDPRFDLGGWHLHTVTPTQPGTEDDSPFTSSLPSADEVLSTLSKTPLQLVSSKSNKLPQGTPYDDIHRTVIYFPGGGFITVMGNDQAKWAINMSKALHARVIVIPYELAPHTNAARAWPRFVKIFEQIWHDAKEKGHEIIVMGDSAGGNVTAILPLAVKELLPHLADERSRDVLDKISPDIIVPMSAALNGVPADNPEVAVATAKEDPLFDMDNVKLLTENWLKGGKEWQEKWTTLKTELFSQEVLELLPQDLRHPYVSPARDDATFQAMKERGVKAVVSAGMKDLLYEGTFQYLRGCEKLSIRCVYVEGLRGCHTYNFMAFNMAESAEGNQLIIDAINEISSVDPPPTPTFYELSSRRPSLQTHAQE